MNTYQNVVILSAELSTNTNESNRQRTLNLEACLQDCGFSFNKAQGVYKGSIEDSFVVLPKNQEEIESLKDFAFKNFKQESVLLQDANGRAILVYNDGRNEEIGRLRQVNPKLVDMLDSYTVLNGTVYSTEEL